MEHQRGAAACLCVASKLRCSWTHDHPVAFNSRLPSPPPLAQKSVSRGLSAASFVLLILILTHAAYAARARARARARRAARARIHTYTHARTHAHTHTHTHTHKNFYTSHCLDIPAYVGGASLKAPNGNWACGSATGYVLCAHRSPHVTSLLSAGFTVASRSWAPLSLGSARLQLLHTSHLAPWRHRFPAGVCCCWWLACTEQV